MTNLRRIMGEEAGPRGVLSFARFMELALYCPNFGYYERTEAIPGRSGDFFTSVSVGELFGQLLAFQFAGWLGQMAVGPRHLVEAGAHEGRLARDILGWMRLRRPDVAERLEYWIIEPSGNWRAKQQETLGELGGSVRWFESWEATPKSGVTGIIFSNELLDAMPVHRVGWDAAARRWFEWGVSLEGDVPVWVRLPVESSILNAGGLSQLPAGLLGVLPEGFTTEVGRAAVAWWDCAAAALRSGKLVAIDYGLTAEEFLTPERSAGTLRAYYRHRVHSDFLARPGGQDLTAHVNFTAVQKAGEARGLKTERFQSQAQFLTGILRAIEQDRSAWGEWTSGDTRQFQTLAHEEHLGRPFRVLVQDRSVSRDRPT
jgi:SAM-dependent MidA family methyltransferase